MPHAHGQLQLALEREQLRLARREVAVIVEAGFPDRDHFRFGVIFAQQRFGFSVKIAGVVRMHARGREQHAGMQLHGRICIPRSLRARAGDDQLRDAVRLRTRQYLRKIMAERFVREIGSDVDQLHGSGAIQAGAALCQERSAYCRVRNRSHAINHQRPNLPSSLSTPGVANRPFLPSLRTDDPRRPQAAPFS